MKRIPTFHLCLGLLAVLLSAWTARAADVMPPKPDRYFTDYTNTVDPTSAAQINRKLDQFERDTSNQLVVVIFPTMQSDSDPADYCTRVFRSWKIGQKGKNNGVALFVFKNDRKMFIATGYGLEGALPDITCKQIIDNEIKPFFRNNQFAQGINAGVTAIIAATKGEYKGTGRTAADKPSGGANWSILIFIIFVFILIWFLRGGGGLGGLLISTMGSSYGGFGSSGGSWGGGGGGGFSGGGGSSGGGGAGGSW